MDFKKPTTTKVDVHRITTAGGIFNGAPMPVAPTPTTSTPTAPKLATPKSVAPEPTTPNPVAPKPTMPQFATPKPAETNTVKVNTAKPAPTETVNKPVTTHSTVNNPTPTINNATPTVAKPATTVAPVLKEHDSKDTNFRKDEPKKKRTKDKTNNSKNKKLYIIASIIVLVVVIVVAAILINQNSNDGDGIDVNKDTRVIIDSNQTTEQEDNITKQILEKYADVKVEGYQEIEEENGTVGTVVIDVKNISGKKINLAVDVVAKDKDGNILDKTSLYAEEMEEDQVYVFNVFTDSELSQEQLQNATIEVLRAYTYGTEEVTE